MPRFAANLTLLYTDRPFLDRFAAAAADGFEAVECLFPYDHPPEAIAKRLRECGLTLALMNLPPGDWAAGERGLAALPGREVEFRQGLERALAYARATGCRRLHAMAGVAPPGAARDEMHRTFVENLRTAARRAAKEGVTLTIEPINLRDMPGYFLNFQQQAHDIVEEVGEPALAVQMDLYHCQIMEGDLTRRLERHLPRVAHIQIAGVPDRHEPDVGEIHYPWVFDFLDRLGYDGYVGCEYRPRGDTSAGLGWLRRWRARGGQAGEGA